ncbi:MAG TPA: carbonic anhydrase, partial [bacterium]|nr:carbonic anhydrase [bacterium]
MKKRKYGTKNVLISSIFHYTAAMKKLIQGIMDFRRTRREGVRELFAKLALGQKPDCFFIACSDSRVAVNVFASTDPGDLFVIRNLGNIMPPFPDGGSAVA